MKYEKQHRNLAVNLFKIFHKSGIFFAFIKNVCILFCHFYFMAKLWYPKVWKQALF